MGIRGFTFIEVILVIILMAVAIPGLVSAVSFVTKAQVNPMGATIAADLAQEEIETVIAKKKSACGTCGYANIAVGVGAAVAVPGFANYQKQTTVAFVDAALNPSAGDVGYKRVTVTVSAVGVGPSVPNAVMVTLLTSY